MRPGPAQPITHMDGMSERTPTTSPCPICSKPAVEKFRPFCSRRCANVDLNRWLSGVYAVPIKDEEDATCERGGPFWTAGNRASINPALLRPRSRGRGAQVAQLVEHCTENAGVGGSIPPLGTPIFQVTPAKMPHFRKGFCRN